MQVPARDNDLKCDQEARHEPSQQVASLTALAQAHRNHRARVRVECGPPVRSSNNPGCNPKRLLNYTVKKREMETSAPSPAALEQGFSAGIVSAPNSATIGDWEARCETHTRIPPSWLVSPHAPPTRLVLPPRFAGLGTPSALGALGAAQPFLSVNLSSPPGWDSMLKATTTRVITVMDRQVRMGIGDGPCARGGGEGGPCAPCVPGLSRAQQFMGSPMPCGSILGSIRCEAGPKPPLSLPPSPSSLVQLDGVPGLSVLPPSFSFMAHVSATWPLMRQML